MPFAELESAFRSVMEEEPPEGLQASKGFEMESPDGEYILCVYIHKTGDFAEELTIEVRPPRGSYGAMENLTYGEIEEKLNGDPSNS